MFSRASKDRLTSRDLDRFAGKTLFDGIARAVCRAGCLPRKELYESWEVARRVRRLFRGGRVVDLGGGHGLLAHVMLILDDSSPSAVVVDKQLPASGITLQQELVEAWPRLGGRVHLIESELDSIAITRSDIVVATHACGRLTDVVISRAVAAEARVAVLPCCHDFDRCDAGPLPGWMNRALAIDTVRALRLEAQGYRVWTQAIASDITPKNRLLIGASAAMVPRLDLDDLPARE